MVWFGQKIAEIGRKIIKGKDRRKKETCLVIQLIQLILNENLNEAKFENRFERENEKKRKKVS